jgi:hypothetical protein
MKKSLTYLVVCTSIALLCLNSASAQSSVSGVQQGMGTFAELINTFNSTIVKALGTLFISGSVVAFFFGLMNFIWGMREGDTKVITNGKQFMIYSLTALFVMFSVYGIVRFFQGLVPGLDKNTITIPEINYGGSGGGSGNSTLRANGASCAFPSDCSSGNCQSGTCVVAGAGSSGSGSGASPNGTSCTFPSDCSSGNCQSGKCSAVGAGSAGGASSPLPDGAVCFSSAQCASGYCQTTGVASQCATSNINGPN